MKADLVAYSQKYRTALGKHLTQSPATSRNTLLSLGRRAVKLGIETLDLATIHEEALISLESARALDVHNGEKVLRLATGFFTEVITPIEETHRGAMESNAEMKVAIKNLSRRSKELTALNGKLKREIDKRQAAEVSLRASEEISSKLLKESLRLQEELRLLSRRLLSVQETMRQRLSRELHDVIAQALTGLDLQLVALKKQAGVNADDFHTKIEITQQLVKESVDILHRFARDLRPAVLDDLGLIPALQSHMKGFMEKTGIRVAFSAFAGLEKINNGVRTALFRVAQEALNNVAQHANASEASVAIRQNNGSICMEIHDDGKGFDVNDAALKKRNRLGLIGMRERVEMIGGQFFIDSVPGKETTVRVEIPCVKVNRKKRASKSSAQITP